jgi:hypothetical protein
MYDICCHTFVLSAGNLLLRSFGMFLRVLLFAKEEHHVMLEERLRQAAGTAVEITSRCTDANEVRIRRALTNPDLICTGPGVDVSALLAGRRPELPGLPHVLRVGGSVTAISASEDDAVPDGWENDPPIETIVSQLEACALAVAHSRTAGSSVIRHPTVEYQADLIALPHQRGIDVRSVMSIVHVKGEGNYTVIHFDKGNQLVMSRTIGDYDDVLPEGQFIRVHRSHIVNLHHIRKIIRGKVMRLVLSNDHEIEVADSKREMVLGIVNLVRRRGG